MSTKAINNYLVRMGVKPTMRGFAQLGDAIKIIIDDNSAQYNLCKSVYVDVAKIHKSTYAQVERNIRTAIQSTGCKQTNKEFIMVAVLVLSGNL